MHWKYDRTTYEHTMSICMSTINVQIHTYACMIQCTYVTCVKVHGMLNMYTTQVIRKTRAHVNMNRL